MTTVEGGLSVVMPSFNKAPHIARAIRSVLEQRAGLDELIIVDDGSTDNTLEQITSFTDARIRLLHRSPPGPGGYAARNLGIEAAKSQWIAFLDADDTWHPEFTQVVSELVEQFGLDIGCVFTGYENFFPDGRRITQQFSLRSERDGIARLDLAGFVDAWITDRDSPVWTGATAFRKQVLIDAGLFPDGRCRRRGDKDLWLRGLAQAHAAYEPRVLATHHRDSVNMVTRTVGMYVRHCNCDTVLAMIDHSNLADRNRLKTLYNLEVYAHSVAALRAGRLDRSTFKGFFIAFDPLRYALLEALAAMPPPFINSVRGIRRYLGSGAVR